VILAAASLPFSFELASEVRDLILQRLDEPGLVGWFAAWFGGIGRLVRLRRTIPQHYIHGAAFFHGRQSTPLYAAADRTLGYAERDCGLGDG